MTEPKNRTWRPAALIEAGIPRTRLLWWQEKQYAPASVRSEKGGIAEYTARDALRAFMLNFFVEQEGFPVEVAAYMLSPVFNFYYHNNQKIDQLLFLSEGTSFDLYLVSINNQPGQLVYSQTTSELEREMRNGLDRAEFRKSRTLLAFYHSRQKINLWVPNEYLAQFEEINSIKTFNISRLIRDFMRRLNIQEGDLA